MKIVTADRMRAIEARSEEAGVTTDTLMENAGLAVARTARRMVGPLTGVPIVVLVGPGNNGADGLVAARHLCRWGARVAAYICRDRGAPDAKLESATTVGVGVTSASDDPELTQLIHLLGHAHLVIDAVLGTGVSRPLEGVLKEVLAALASAKASRSAARLLALDLPTGLNSDTAEVDPACVAADVTVALGYPKRGLLEFPGADYVGRLEVADIGIPSGMDVETNETLMTGIWAQRALPPRSADSHKGTFGRAMLVVGSRNFLGAACLAATSAARVGAGLVTIAIPASLVPAVAPRAVEPTFLPLPESSHGVVSTDAVNLILDSLPAYSALLVGCGLGQADQTRIMVERLLLSGERLPPTVVDADGLNTLSRTPDWPDRWSTNGVLTPHPGEMGRLVSDVAWNSNAGRIELALTAARYWNKTVVLKGANTVIAHANGSANVSPFANPGLATAGTGDVLAGAIAGLLSQQLPLEVAAPLGVYIHAAAGENVRLRLGDCGMIASDLLPALPGVIRDLKKV